MASKLKIKRSAKQAKAAATPAGEKRAHFFQKQLVGEDPLTWATAEKLYKLSAFIFRFQPWRFLGDQDLLLVRDPKSGEIAYCSVMGALGEVFSLHVYLGAESYRFFRRVAAGEEITPDEFMATLTGVSVEFVKISELTAPDRELLNWFNHPMQRGSRAPSFRALRPGYHPWYITETEGITLAECMQGLVAFCVTFVKNPDAPYWETEDVYPMLVPAGEGGFEHGYRVERVRAGEPPVSPPSSLALDETRLRKVREKDHAMSGCLEADCFHALAAIGGKDERKALLRVGLVADAASGFLFPPELGTPEHSLPQILLNSVLNAIETAGLLPAEVRIANEEFKTLLGPVLGQLGISVQVRKSLPAVQRARHALLSKMMGV